MRFPLARVKLTGGRARGTALPGAPTATAAAVAFAARPPAPAAEHGEVACRGPPLAWTGRRLQ